MDVAQGRELLGELHVLLLHVVDASLETVVGAANALEVLQAPLDHPLVLLDLGRERLDLALDVLGHIRTGLILDQQAPRRINAEHQVRCLVDTTAEAQLELGTRSLHVRKACLTQHPFGSLNPGESKRTRRMWSCRLRGPGRAR